MKKKRRFVLSVFYFLIISSCSSLKTHVNFYEGIIGDIKTENYSLAENKIETAKKDKKYLNKDMVLYYLDKGAVLHYQGNYDDSNQLFELADRTMEELFTKSISKIATSYLVNDNVLDYSGDIHDCLYVNVFKAINYLKLDKFDDAYVEINRVNDKLRELDYKYGEIVEKFNNSDVTKIKIEKKRINFYDDALAHYISYLVFRAEGEYDNSRISFEKIQKAWDSQPHVYDFAIPAHLKSNPNSKGTFLNVIAFTGNAPIKNSSGGQITTYDNYIHVSDLTYLKTNVVMRFPGMKEGFHFKFAFPEIYSAASNVSRIEVYIDNNFAGQLELLEDIGRIAQTTFETKKHLIYLKTIIRTIIKGIESAKMKETLRQGAGIEEKSLLSRILNFGVDKAVDATENPDLRCWRTLPKKCYIGEFQLNPGINNIKILFYSRNGALLKEKIFSEVEITNGLNLIEAFCLN